tara:strand:- start:4174 stop:4641 length:468 start_codon:yes stop_codon:yes gene_type:complete
VTQEHALRSATQGSEAGEEGFFKGSFGSLGPTGGLESMSENFPSAAIDDRNKDTPAIASAVDHGEIGGSALVGIFGNRTGELDPRPATSSAFRKNPALEFHDAVDLLSVHFDPVTEAQAAPGASHPAGRLLAVDALDACRHGLVDGPRLALPGLE